MAKNKKQKNKKHILFRYALITGGFVLLAIAVSAKLFETTIVRASEWNERAKEQLTKTSVIDPERGSILADNGAILACNVTVYDIKADLAHPRFLKNPPEPEEVEALADSLDKYYPKREFPAGTPADTLKKYSWKPYLKEQFARTRPNRALTLVKGGEQRDYERIRLFPVFQKFSKWRDSQNPLYFQTRPYRIKPFGKMARLSIGAVNQQPSKDNPLKSEFHGWCGLESDLDRYLYGSPGIAKRVTTTNGLGQWVEKAAINGYDIQTTINIDLQDMLEAELLKVCNESGAEWGTALLMEVATGEIKAITNVEMVNGDFGQALNRAVLPFEPGSVMKPISLMIAFEDGLVKSVNDRVDCSPFQKTSDPHAPSVKTMKQVVEMSSNTGISRVIFRGYKDHPEKFYDRLESIGFFEPMNTGIKEEKRPMIRRLVDKDSKGNNITMTARHLDLARQSFGYATMIPPLYTLSVYNAIANKGKYVRPRLVKKFIGHGVPDSIVPVSYIRERICSEETAEKVKQCIKEVVWGDHGTARAVRDDRVMIAGKTGTAFPVEKGGYNKAKRRYAFCGFFPYDNPKYSCMVLIQAGGGTSANRTSGQVLKNMAVQMYAHGLLDDAPQQIISPSVTTPLPVMMAGRKENTGKVKKSLNISKASIYEDLTSKSAQGTVPDVKGHDPLSAIEVLEKSGLNVVLKGQGRVRKQSLNPGSKIRRGSTITLFLGA